MEILPTLPVAIGLAIVGAFYSPAVALQNKCALTDASANQLGYAGNAINGESTLLFSAAGLREGPA
jgi:hypothetical protein